MQEESDRRRGKPAAGGSRDRIQVCRPAQRKGVWALRL